MSNRATLQKLSNLAIYHQEKCRDEIDLQTAREHRRKSERFEREAAQIRARIMA